MRTPFDVCGTIPVSGTHWAEKTIPLVRARTLSITTRVDFPAAAASDAVVSLYYSPDGNNWDTIVYTTWNITVTASATVQRTCIIDCPEHGYIWVKVTNGSSAKTLISVKQWYTIQSWDEVGASTMEHPYVVERKRQKREETGPMGAI